MCKLIWDYFGLKFSAETPQHREDTRILRKWKHTDNVHGKRVYFTQNSHPEDRRWRTEVGTNTSDKASDRHLPWNELSSPFESCPQVGWLHFTQKWICISFHSQLSSETCTLVTFCFPLTGQWNWQTSVQVDRLQHNWQRCPIPLEHHFIRHPRQKRGCIVTAVTFGALVSCWVRFVEDPCPFLLNTLKPKRLLKCVCKRWLLKKDALQTKSEWRLEQIDLLVSLQGDRLQWIQSIDQDLWQCFQRLQRNVWCWNIQMEAPIIEGHFPKWYVCWRQLERRKGGTWIRHSHSP